MAIQNIVAQGDQVMLELDWTGTAAIAIGPLQPGSKVHLKVANFLTFEQGLIVKQVDYCIAMPRPAG
jgi:predicted ester cyclase